MTQMIENSDRGITMNKALAWTVGTGLVTGSLFVGLTIATLSTKLDATIAENNRASTDRGQIKLRLRSLEGDMARQDERYNSILSLLARIDGRLERIEGVRP